MRNKRGLSGIVATLLIILLVIVAVAVVWTVVRNVLDEGSEKVGFSTITTGVDVQGVQVAGDTASVTVKRDVGEGNVVGVKVVVSDGQNSVSEEFMQPMEELEERTFDVDISELGGDPVEVLVAPILTLDSGDQVLGEITDTYVVGEENLGGGVGGGDPECGNDVIEGEEVCDGTDLDDETCITQGFDSGDLACLVGCDGFDTSACSGGTCTDGEKQDCALQEGVCLGSQQTCTGSAWPGCEDVYTAIPEYEAEETSCSDGLDNDCDGLTDIDDETCTLLLSDGSISSIWPGSAPRYFDSTDLPADSDAVQTYINTYVRFSSNYDLCYRVTVAGHEYDEGPPAYNMSHLGFTYAITHLTDVDIYDVYKTEDACIAA